MSQAQASSPTATRLVLIGAVVVALVMRVLYATRSGFWRDEALFLGVTRLPTVADVLAFLRLHESHPPLFYLMQRGWEAVVGHGDLAVVMLPVLFGVALVPAAYAVARRMFSPEAGLLAAVLVATSPILTEHAALARPYSLFPLLTLGMAYALWRAIGGAGPRAWAAFGALSGLALLTHNYAWIELASLDLVAAVLLRGRVLALAAANLLAVAFVAPWLPAFVYQVQHAGHAPNPVTTPWHPLFMFAKTYSSIPNPFVGAAVALAALGLIAWAARRGDRPAYALFTLAPLVVLAVSAAGSGHGDLLWPRTLLGMVPCFLIAASGALAALIRDRRGLGLVGLAAAGGYLVVAGMLLTVPKSNARELAQGVASRVQPEDLVVVSPDWIATSFNYYFAPANRQIDYPQEGREAVTAFDHAAERIYDVAAFRRVKGELQAYRKANKRVWLVVDDGFFVGAVPETDELPPSYNRSHWNMVSAVRTSQLAHELQRLYGRPAKQLRTPEAQSGSENLTALLFAPPEAGAQPRP